VNQYFVSGIDNFGYVTADSDVWSAEYYLAPAAPTVSTQGSNLRVNAAGFVGCTPGTTFAVSQWLLTYAYNGDPNVYSLAFDPNVGSVTIAKPANGQLVSLSLSGTAENLYESDQNSIVTLPMYNSEDLCVGSNGSVDPNDADCRDLDLSQPVPPPSYCQANCVGGGGMGPAEMYDAWQTKGMKQEILRPRRAALNVPEPPGSDVETLPGEQRWKVASVLRNEGASESREGAARALPLPDLFAEYLVPALEASFARSAGASDPLSSRLPEPTLLCLLQSEPTSLSTDFSPSFSGGPAPADEWLPDDSRVNVATVDAGGINLPVCFLVTGATAKSFSWQFFSWDHLRSVRVVTDVSGNKLYDSKYLPFGEEITGATNPGSDNGHKFTGHERDGEAGVDYMLARYRALSAGPFVSVDPSDSSSSLFVPGSWNKYTYVINRPMVYVDPDGRGPELALGACLLDPPCAGIAVGAVVVGFAAYEITQVVIHESQIRQNGHVIPQRTPGRQNRDPRPSPQRPIRDMKQNQGPPPEGPPGDPLPPGQSDAYNKWMEVLLGFGVFGGAAGGGAAVLFYDIVPTEVTTTLDQDGNVLTTETTEKTYYDLKRASIGPGPGSGESAAEHNKNAVSPLYQGGRSFWVIPD